MIGDLAALVCALLFALCSLAFAVAGREVGSLLVNQTRIIVATLMLLALHAIWVGGVWPAGLSERQLVLLLVSGVIGLSLGDLFYFHALAVLGPRIGTLLMSTFPLFVILGEGLWLGRWPGLSEGGLMLVIVAGVAFVLSEKKAAGGSGDWVAGVSPGRYLGAVLAGILGALGQGAGLVLAKGVEPLAASAAEVPVHSLSMAYVRMVAGVIGMAVVFGLRQAQGDPAARLSRLSRRVLWFIFIGALTGPTLGVWLSMVAVEHGSAARAGVLIALTPVLMLPIAFLAYGDRPRARAWLGTVVAFVGTVLLLSSRG